MKKKNSVDWFSKYSLFGYWISSSVFFIYSCGGPLTESHSLSVCQEISHSFPPSLCIMLINRTEYMVVDYRVTEEVRGRETEAEESTFLQVGERMSHKWRSIEGNRIEKCVTRLVVSLLCSGCSFQLELMLIRCKYDKLLKAPLCPPILVFVAFSSHPLPIICCHRSFTFVEAVG